MSNQTQNKSKTVKLGTVRKNKSGKGVHFQLNSDIAIIDFKGNKHEFKAKDTLFINDPREQVKFRLERGFITEQQAEEQLSKIPEFVKFEVTGKSE